MNREKGSFRVSVGLASAFLGAFIAFRALNATATASHPVGQVARQIGFAAILLIATGCYGFAARGFSNRLAQLAMLFGVIGGLWVSLQWFIPVQIVCAGIAVTALWLLLRRREGRYHLMALVIVLLCAGIGTALLAAPYAAASRYFRDEPWICVALGCGFVASLAVVVGVAYTAGSRLLPVEPRQCLDTPSHPHPAPLSQP